MEDPDVPKTVRMDGIWDHWIVFNIPPKTRIIPEGEEPEGVHGKDTNGDLQYFGPCPPDREHRYYFRLFALDMPLHIPEGVTKDQVKHAMEEHILARAELMGRYERRQFALRMSFPEFIREVRFRDSCEENRARRNPFCSRYRIQSWKTNIRICSVLQTPLSSIKLRILT
jgi:Raf kinase inhibitor-like YbhB/YbcL family protein